jgi:NDP-sugar pyrophosphorylase family protein
VTLTADGRVAGFVPRGPGAAGSFHFIGAQIVSRSVFAGLAPGQPVSSIGGCYDALLAREPGAVRGFVGNASFWDIGTVADYWHTSSAWSMSQGAASSTAEVHRSAVIDRTIFWDDVKVGADATLEECIVTDSVRVPAGANYRRKILMRATDGTTSVAPLEID